MSFKIPLEVWENDFGFVSMIMFNEINVLAVDTYESWWSNVEVWPSEAK